MKGFKGHCWFGLLLESMMDIVVVIYRWIINLLWNSFRFSMNI